MRSHPVRDGLPVRLGQRADFSTRALLVAPKSEQRVYLYHAQVRWLPLVALGLSLGAFFAISFIGCILLGLIVPDGGMHRPWLQLFPGFEWLTARGVVLGLVWTQVYAWWAALAFGSRFNFFAARSG